MASAWLDQVFNQHREPWYWVETIGFDMASAGVPWFSVKFVGLTDKT
jgi:hypothetical protein